MVCWLNNKTNEKVIKEDIKTKVDDFLESVNQNLPEGMELEFEGFYQRGFFVTKKRYALIEDSNIVVKGLELVRRDWAPVAKKTQKKVFGFCFRMLQVGLEPTTPAL